MKKMSLDMIITITCGSTVIILLIIAFLANFSRQPVVWGVTFSQEYTETELRLDWKKTYAAILDDLKVDHIRLSAYWNKIEPFPGTYNYSDLDWQVEQASQRDVKIILAVGRRLPRWPECHNPDWANDLSAKKLQDAQLQYIEKTVERYKNNPNVIAWQVENEPFLKTFGICPALDKDFLDKEIALVKKLSNKPTIITDTGELSSWIPAAKTNTDILGTTLYRVVYNPYIGYFRWPLPPLFYYLKSKIALSQSHKQKVIVAELQTESWHKANTNLREMELKDHFESLSIDQFKSNVSFAQKAGFDEIYLWGVEWWYFMKENRGYPDYWNEAKKLWQK